MEFQYPQSDLDRPRNLLALLGTFWTKLFARGDQLETFCEAVTQLSQQTYRDTLETLASISRYTVPIYHRDNWFFLTLRESDRNSVNVSLPKFGEGYAFDSAIQFDTPVTGRLHAFPLPDKLRNAPLIMNRLTLPSVTLTQQLDFMLDVPNDRMLFRENPLDNPLIASRPVYENGEVVDHEAGLWVFQGDFDFEHIYTQFGYVLGLRLKSSKAYRDLLNAVFDGLVGGTTAEQLDLALAAMTGIPLTLETSERVELIREDDRALMVITDQHVYKFPPCTVPIVAEGDEVLAGDPLVDAVRVYELNLGAVPEALHSIAIGRGLLANCYYGELVFENRDTHLYAEPAHSSGYTYCNFALGGFELDVVRFFDDMHAKGVAEIEAGQDLCVDTRRRGTLAHLLDKRENPQGEPVGLNLPKTINPMQFLITNVLRGNAFIVHVRVSGLGRSGLGLYNIRHLMKLLPPHTAMILVYDLIAPQERLVPTDRIAEDLSFFTGAEPQRDAVPRSKIVERSPGARFISGTCQ